VGKKSPHVCELARILGLTGPNNQVSLTIMEHSAQGMVHAPRVGKAPDYPSVLQAVHVTIAKPDIFEGAICLTSKCVMSHTSLTHVSNVNGFYVSWQIL